MEKIVYIIVRLGALSYILHQVWLFLFRNNGLWFFLKHLTPVKKDKKEKQVQAITDNEEDCTSIVGKSHTVYLKDSPEGNEDEPILSIDMEPTDYLGEDEDLSADDVEFETKQVAIDDILDENERFIPFEEDFPPDMNFSTGMTYDELFNAVDVIQGKEKSEEDRMNAARLLYEIKQTDMMDFFSAQAGNVEVIELLFKENLDESGEPLPQKVRRKSSKSSAVDFDINQYV